MLIDLAGGTVFDEETTENSETAHPEDLAVNLESVYSPVPQFTVKHYALFIAFISVMMAVGCVPWHASIRSTLPFTETTMSANSSGGVQCSGTCT